MAFCSNCGTKVEDGVKFCPSCGTQMQAQAQPSPAQQAQPQPTQPQQAPTQPQTDYSEKLKALNNTADTTASFDPNDINANKVMALLSYFGPLVLIPIFVAKTSRFARFHANQGLVLWLGMIAFTIANSILSGILSIIKLGFISSLLGSVVSIAVFVLALIGLINAVNGRAKELPVIGKFTLLK